MRIGVDVDGVLTNMEEYQLKYGKKFFKKNDEEIDATQIDVKDIFSVSKVEREKFWLKYIWRYCQKEEPKMNSVPTLQKLKADGHEIVIITGRAHTTEKGITGNLFRKMLLKWLAKHEIPYDKIVYCRENGSEEDKVLACEENKIDVMIDDKKENIEALSKTIPVLCFDAKYNQGCLGNNIIRVYNFNDVYREINKLCTNKAFTTKSVEEIETMSVEEKIRYFDELKHYLMNLPFDHKLHEHHEKNYKKLCHVAIPFFRGLFKPVVIDREFVPNENGVIFVANHNNYYDQFPIIAALNDDRPIHFLTATKMLKMKRGKLYINTGAISVDRMEAKDRENSSTEIKKLLVNGKNVFIFPEGRTNRKEAFLLEFKPGAVAIARDTGCKIVPIAVNDNYSKKQGPLCVRFGEPFVVNPEDDVIQKTEELKQIIGKMKQQNIDYVEQQKIKKK